MLEQVPIYGEVFFKVARSRYEAALCFPATCFYCCFSLGTTARAIICRLNK
jgi:hypothetical protein